MVGFTSPGFASSCSFKKTEAKKRKSLVGMVNLGKKRDSSGAKVPTSPPQAAEAVASSASPRGVFSPWVEPRLTYDHGDAIDTHATRRGPEFEAKRAADELAAAEERVEREVGHSYWDDRVLGAGVEKLTSEPCRGCSEEGCGVKLVGRSRGRGRGSPV